MCEWSTTNKRHARDEVELRTEGGTVKLVDLNQEMEYGSDTGNYVIKFDSIEELDSFYNAALELMGTLEQ